MHDDSLTKIILQLRLLKVHLFLVIPTNYFSMPHPPTHSESEYPAILGGEKASLEESHSALLQDQAIQLSLENAWNDGSWARYHGPHCEKLTTQIAQFLEVKNVRLCASGTAAVDLALQGANIQPGDEVILAAYDFKSNIGNLLARKAVPVLVELQQNDWQISIAAIQNAITPKTRAIIATHLHGGLVDMPRLTEVARQHQISIIEDACQATGAIISGKQAGTWGDIGVWSFGGSKLLTAGRGGAVFTSNTQIAQRIRIWAERGNDLSPLSELQAAVLLPQLESLPKANTIRHAHVLQLKYELESIPGIEPLAVSLEKSIPSYYKLGMQYDEAKWNGLTRDQFATSMRAEGIKLDAGFRSLHLIHGKSRFRAACDLKQATLADQSILVLHHSELLKSNRIPKIVHAIKKTKTHSKQIKDHLTNQTTKD